MITLSIRYTIDARKRPDFERYARALGAIIARCGGDLVGYWLPTLFAGPTNLATALIDFPSPRVVALARRIGLTKTGTRPGSAWMRARGWEYTEWRLTRAEWSVGKDT
jgi:hypothetical protein